MEAPILELALLQPMPEQSLQAFGEAIVLDLRRFFAADWFDVRTYALTHHTDDLATATLAGSLLILTPNHSGLAGKLGVEVTAVNRGMSTTAWLHVTVESARRNCYGPSVPDAPGRHAACRGDP